MNDRLIDMSVGQLHELVLALQNAGLTRQQGARLVSDPAYAAKVAAALQEATHIEPTGFVGAAGVPGVFTNYVGGGSDLPDWYVYPDSQLEQQESWLKSLGFGQGDIPTGGPEGVMPTRNALPLLRVVVPGTRRAASRRRTIDVHMDAIGQQLTATSRKLYLWDAFKAFQKEPRLATGLSDPAPGVSWVLFDPFAHWDAENGHRVSDLHSVQNGWSLAGTENLSALKVWPGYGPAMNGTKVPYINLAGLRTASGGVPYAFWWVGGSELEFDVDSADCRISSTRRRASGSATAESSDSWVSGRTWDSFLGPSGTARPFSVDVFLTESVQRRGVFNWEKYE